MALGPDSNAGQPVAHCMVSSQPRAAVTHQCSPIWSRRTTNHPPAFKASQPSSLSPGDQHLLPLHLRSGHPPECFDRRLRPGEVCGPEGGAGDPGVPDVWVSGRVPVLGDRVHAAEAGDRRDRQLCHAPGVPDLPGVVADDGLLGGRPGLVFGAVGGEGASAGAGAQSRCRERSGRRPEAVGKRSGYCRLLTPLGPQIRW